MRLALMPTASGSTSKTREVLYLCDTSFINYSFNQRVCSRSDERWLRSHLREVVAVWEVPLGRGEEQFDRFVLGPARHPRRSRENRKKSPDEPEDDLRH